ncbi:hypothetical protein PJ267_04860 [Arthrobacter sp. OVS8]|nr:hypothetical protein PJ267_04860 [Arthrobacter sp. OVS8]
MDGTVSVCDHYVYRIIQGRRLAAFTLVLGSQAPEVVYDGQCIRTQLIPEGMNVQIDLAKNVDNIVEFLLSDRNPVEQEPHLWPTLSMPMADGAVWRLKKFD